MKRGMDGSLLIETDVNQGRMDEHQVHVNDLIWKKKIYSVDWFDWLIDLLLYEKKVAHNDKT